MELRSAVLRAVMRSLQAHYVKQARAEGGEDPNYAAISVVQRGDGAARLNVHFHILCGDGAFCKTANGIAFIRAPPLKQAVVEHVFADMLTRIERQCAKLPDPTENPQDPLRERQPALAALLRNAMLGNKTNGNSARKALRVSPGQGPLAIKGSGHNCLQANGFSLHANTTVGPLARDALERLCKYICRPAIAASRLEAVDDHNIRIHLKNEWAGGVKSVLVSPRDLVIRALAQVPLPRRPSIRYHGCFAPNSHLRKLVVPAGAMAKARRKKSCVEKDETTRLTWSLALRRAFGWDVLKCPCGGTRTVVAAVQDANEIKRFLTHLHLYPDPGDIVSITGPPEMMEFVDVEPEPEPDWDDSGLAEANVDD